VVHPLLLLLLLVMMMPPQPVRILKLLQQLDQPLPPLHLSPARQAKHPNRRTECVLQSVGVVEVMG